MQLYAEGEDAFWIRGPVVALDLCPGSGNPLRSDNHLELRSRHDPRQCLVVSRCLLRLIVARRSRCLIVAGCWR